jgi:hypothetical protein
VPHVIAAARPLWGASAGRGTGWRIGHRLNSRVAISASGFETGTLTISVGDAGTYYLSEDISGTTGTITVE